MLIGMNLTIGPAGRIKATGLEWNQNGLLLGLEDLGRYPAGRSMDAAARGIPAPEQRSPRHIVQVDERFTLEKPLPSKTHGIFDDRDRKSVV